MGPVNRRTDSGSATGPWDATPSQRGYLLFLIVLAHTQHNPPPSRHRRRNIRTFHYGLEPSTLVYRQFYLPI
jgi:hypothetical protein